VNARDQGGETALAAMILRAWKITTFDELVQQANSTPPPDFPRLFPIVLRAADEGDAIARDLLEQAGAKLANLAAIVVRRLAPQTFVAEPAAAPLARAVLPSGHDGQCLSSVFRSAPDFLQYAASKTFPASTCAKILADPVQGALARARRT
jgi:glucosamine kinase